jgi:hypothetical protein
LTSEQYTAVQSKQGTCKPGIAGWQPTLPWLTLPGQGQPGQQRNALPLLAGGQCIAKVIKCGIPAGRALQRFEAAPICPCCCPFLAADISSQEGDLPIQHCCRSVWQDRCIAHLPVCSDRTDLVYRCTFHFVHSQQAV